MRSTGTRLVAVVATFAPSVVAVPGCRGHHEATKRSAGNARGDTRWLTATAAGSHIAGVVIGEDGAPVAGAIVRLASPLTAPGVVAPTSAPTDAAGRFDLGPQAPIEYLVSAESPKTTAAVVRVDLRDPHPTSSPDQLRLVLHACVASIHGIIYDPDDGPIREATVTRRAFNPPHELQTPVVARADEHGEYELCVPIGEAPLLISAPGYPPRPDFVNISGRTRRDIRLARGAPLAGRVVRADDTSPVAGALVEVREPPSQENPSIQTTVTDDRGTFHIDAVTPGKHFVTAKADRMATLHGVEVIAEPGVPKNDIECELVVAPSVSGKVVDATTHQPLAGERVHLRPSASLGGWDDGESAITANDGSFLVERVRPGEYSMLTTGRQESDAATSALVEGVDIVGIVLEVEPRASIEGRVLARGTPVEGAFVRIGPRSAYSAADGRFVIERIPAGKHDVASHSWRIGAYASGPTITLAGGEHKSMDVELDLVGTVDGVVVDQDDVPVGSAVVSLVTSDGWGNRSATSADDGTFIVHTQTKGGQYTVEVRSHEGAATVYPVVAGAEPLHVTLADDKSRVAGLHVKVRVERLGIAGRVIDATGTPVPNVEVTAIPRERHRILVPGVSTDASGAFIIRDLEPDAYRLRATGPGYRGDLAGVAAGAKDVTITLVAAGSQTPAASR